MRTLTIQAPRVIGLSFLLFIILLLAFSAHFAPESNARAAIAVATSTPFPCETPPSACSNPPVVTVNSPQAPCDVCVPSGFPSNPIEFFDDYSWRTFIALVWPAQTANNQRGVPDTTQTVGGSGPRVFETYKALWEVFHRDGSVPVAWNENEPASMNACGKVVGAGDLVLASFSKFSDLGQAGFGSLVGPLVAQNTTYVHFLTAYNQVEFDQILNGQWYVRGNLPTQISFANGSIDVKSAWIDMENTPHPERYYIRMAWVMDANGDCGAQQRLVGLVGLHIVQKTPTRPQWIWSTFEQVDNVPPNHAGSPGTFGFNDGTATPMPTRNPYSVNPLPVPVPAPFNVTRVMPIHPSTQNTNRLYQQALSTQGSGIWQFYQLVMTQWPIPPNAPNSPPPPTFPPVTRATSSFANITLETFDQGRINQQGQNVGGTGCIGCHNVSLGAPGTDFLWSLKDHAFPPTIPGLLMQDPSFRTLMTMMQDERKAALAAPKVQLKGPAKKKKHR